MCRNYVNKITQSITQSVNVRGGESVFYEKVFSLKLEVPDSLNEKNVLTLGH